MSGGARRVALRREGRNEPASPNLVIAEKDVVLAVAPNKEALAEAGTLLGEAAPGHFVKDRSDLDYLRVFASRPALIGKTIGELDLPGEKASVVIQVRRGDADILPRPDLVLVDASPAPLPRHSTASPRLLKPPLFSASSPSSTGLAPGLISRRSSRPSP